MELNKLSLFKALQQEFSFMDYTIAEIYFDAIQATKQGKSLVITGDVGVGKTSMLKLLRKWGVIKFISIKEKEIRRDFISAGVKGISELYKLPNLLIDDIGTALQSSKYMGNELDVIEDLLYSRLEDDLNTHITTNLNTDDLKQYIGLRAFDRLCQKNAIIEYKGTSKRTIPIKEKEALNESPKIVENNTVDWQFKIDEHIELCKKQKKFVETWAATHLATDFFLFLEKQGKIKVPLEEKRDAFDFMIKNTKGYFNFQGIKKSDEDIRAIAIQRCRAKYYKDYVLSLII